MEANGKALSFCIVFRTYIDLLVYPWTCEAKNIVEYSSPLASLPIYILFSLSSIWQLNLISNKGG